MKYDDGSVYEGKIDYGGRKVLGKLTNADGTIDHFGIWYKDKSCV